MRNLRECWTRKKIPAIFQRYASIPKGRNSKLEENSAKRNAFHHAQQHSK